MKIRIILTLAALLWLSLVAVSWAAPYCCDCDNPPACDDNEEAYDKEHRGLLGLPPGVCVPPIPGYPSAAAGWLEAIQAQQEGRLPRPYDRSPY